MALIAIIQGSYFNALAAILPSSLEAPLQIFVSTSTSRTWAWFSLISSVSSIWWNPMFKQMSNGFMNHIKGFGDWYKLQFLLIVVRSLFYYTMGTSVFADPFSVVSQGAHVFILCFVTLVCKLYKCLCSSADSL